MKKLYFLLPIVAISLLLTSCVPSKTSSDDKVENTGGEQKAPAEQSLRDKLFTGATMVVPDTDIKVTLTKDVTEFGDLSISNRENFGSYGTVAVGKEIAAIGDKGIVTFLALNFGGSGESYYLTVFEPGETSWSVSDMQLLGDRIEVEDIKTEDNLITVNYKEHGEDQAMAEEPKVEVEKAFEYTGGKLLTN